MLVGISSGVGIWLFKSIIDLADKVFFGYLFSWLQRLGNWTVFFLPALGGLVVGLLVKNFIGEERHHGVAGIMEAVALAGGRLRYRRTPAKIIASAVSIGSGASVGPEDPSVQIGANLGSFFGQKLRLSEERIRSLVAAGAASGIAAAFNAPIAGVFFALEIILGEISGGALGIIVLASVASSVLTQAISGSQPAFSVPAYAFNAPIELIFYLGLGLLAGPLASLYVHFLYWMKDIFSKMEQIPSWGKPLVAGVLVGLVGIFLPDIFGVGYELIDSILAGALPPIGLLIMLIFAKLIFTSISIGGGFMGGVFAPALFLGATLGSLYAILVGRLIPWVPLNPIAFAMVGMAAVLAGAVHAPLTAMILLFEMTHDYRIILPLMFAVLISMLVSQRLDKDSVYTLSLVRKGIRLERGRDIEILEMISVSEVMQIEPMSLQEDDTLLHASDILTSTRHHGLPVLNKAGHLVGLFTLQDLDRSDPDFWTTQTVGQYCSRNVITAFPDETIGTVLRRMGQRDFGRLPVVAREDTQKLVGLLRRSEVIRAYDSALTKRETMRHRIQQVRLDASTQGAGVEEIMVEAGALCDSKLVREIDWPRGCLIARIRRGHRSFIPHGETRLQAGDVLLVVVEGQAQQTVELLCKKPVFRVK